MQEINNHQIKNIALLSTLAIASVAIQVIAQSCYPTFDHSATNANVELSFAADNNQ